MASDEKFDGLALGLSIYKQVEQEAGRYPIDNEDEKDFINKPDEGFL